MDSQTVSQEDIQHFVGKNRDYYLRTWTHLAQPSKIIKWNWAAFLLGPIWLAYRKELWPALAITLVYLLAEYFEQAELDLVLSLAFGLFGNYYYLNQAAKKIMRTKAQNVESEVQQEAIAKLGGTSAIGVLIMIVVLILFSTGTINGHEVSLLQSLFPR